MSYSQIFPFQSECEGSDDDKPTSDKDDEPATIKDDKPTDDDKPPADDDISVKSDDDPECLSCHMRPGTEQVWPYCQKGKALFCSDCYYAMPDEVEDRKWCGFCKTCAFGNVKVKLGKKQRKGKGKKVKLTTCGRDCKPSEDIRSRCEINCKAKNSNDQFLACPARVDTTAWTIANEYGLYKLAEKGDFTYLDQFDFTDEDKMAIIASYHEDR